MFVAQQLNTFLPKLPVSLKWEHISTAHYLPTKARKSQVIIVRFANRCLKDMIFENRHLLPSHLGITEHLTDRSLNIMNVARKLFGYDAVFSRDCKVIVDLYGRDHLVTSVDSVNGLFIHYCEFLGQTNAELSIPRSRSRPANKSKSFTYAAAAAKKSPSSATANKVSSQSFYRSK